MKIVLTGAPHSGKTTLINLLEKQGYHVVHELALELISEKNREIGVEEQKRWRHEQPLEFLAEIVRRQYARESTLDPGGGPYFLDRGLIDPVAYAIVEGVNASEEMHALASKATYSCVIICSIVTPLTDRRRTGRSSSLDRAERIEDQIRSTYQEFQFEPKTLAVAPPLERMNRLLQAVGLLPSERKPGQDE